MSEQTFGSWLSGFVDGEGCFALAVCKMNGYRVPTAHFVIQLRADDIDVLIKIQQYLKCGSVAYNPNNKGAGTSKPSARFTVHNTQHLHDILIPHFEKYPLEAKKQRDFAIWSKGVKFLVNLKTLKGRGRVKRWTPARIEAFNKISLQLRKVREYIEPTSQIRVVISSKHDRSGEKSHTAKLTPDQVRSIRKYHAGGMSQKDNAAKHNIGYTAVFNIVHGLKWTHIK
jgi:hypothetical protein